MLEKTQTREKDLRISEERLQSILDNSTAVVYLKDTEGRFILVNRRFETLFHVKRAELVGKTDYDLFPKELSDAFRVNDLRVLTAAAPLEFEEVAQHDDGLHTYISIKFPLLDANGVPNAVCGISTDITDRKRAEQAQAHLAAIVESSSDPIISQSLDGIVNTWNRAAELLYGYSSAEMIGQSILRLFPPDRVAAEEHILSRVRAGQSVERYETVRIAKDGRHIPVSLTISPIKDSAGKIIGASKVVRDITERLRLQREILEISDREKARIGQDLHDSLCQLLVRTAFACDLLEQEITDKSSPQAVRASKISLLLDDAITQARNIARGLYPVNLGAEGFDPALKALCADIGHEFNISCELVCRVPVLVEDGAVAMHLYRIAQEALTNAVKHAECTRIVVGLVDGKTAITLTIADDGVGIERVSRSHQGLGLQIMNYRARLIGASLEVANCKTGGALVRCVVPRRERDAKTEGDDLV